MTASHTSAGGLATLDFTLDVLHVALRSIRNPMVALCRLQPPQ